MNTSPPNDTVLIKKYSNRKLYDLAQSRYITLEEIADLIREGKHAKIVDAETQEDLTSVTLVQVLLERERRRNLLPVGFLHQLIKYGEMYHDLLHRYLATNVEMLIRMQEGAGKGFQDLNPLAGWKEAMRQEPPRPSSPHAVAEPESGDNQVLRAEIEHLKEQLKELERRLGKP